MVDDPKQYSRLPGSRRAYSVLWLGADHILFQSRALFTDSFRRYYLRDIQAFIIRRTNRGLIESIFAGVLFALLFLAGLSAGSAYWVFWFLGSFFLVFLFVNIALGPTCDFHIRTAVSIQRLGSITRLRTAERFLGRVRPAITGVQGEMADDLLRQGASRSQAHPAWAPPAQLGPRHYGGRAHGVLFTVMMGCFAFAGLQFMAGGSQGLAVVGLLALLAQLICAIVAVVKQAGTDLPRGLRYLAVAGIVIVCGVYAATVGASPNLLMELDRPDPLGPETDLPAELNWLANGPGFVGGIVSGLAGAVGWLQLVAFRRRWVNYQAAFRPAIGEAPLPDGGLIPPPASDAAAALESMAPAEEEVNHG